MLSGEDTAHVRELWNSVNSVTSNGEDRWSGWTKLCGLASWISSLVFCLLVTRTARS